jgi:hypothetical protein
MNPNAIHIIEKNINKLNHICWYYLSKNTNPNAIHIIEKNIRQHNWKYICSKSNNTQILESGIYDINWVSLCSNKNPNAIKIIEKNIHRPELNYDRDCWEQLSMNPNTLHIIEMNFNKICWNSLCTNKNINAINIIFNNIDQINQDCWYLLCNNPNAIELIEKNIDKIDYSAWRLLCNNPKAIKLIEMNIDKFNSNNHIWISENPSLFDLDYKLMSIERSSIIYQELISKALKGSRVSKWLDYFIEQGNGIEDFDWVSTN